MNTWQGHWQDNSGWKGAPAAVGFEPDLVMVFGSRRVLEEGALASDLKERWPSARVVGCSTAGEILGTEVWDDSAVVTACSFERTKLEIAKVHIDEHADGRAVGVALVSQLTAHPGLQHVLVFSDGVNVNGSELVKGLADALPDDVLATGGLSGDGADFQQTCLLFDGDCLDRAVIAVGFYGDYLRVGHGSLGGWDPFGPERIVTRSAGNVLYEVDGHSALELYKRYLGDHAEELPQSAMLFPLSLRTGDSDSPVVRTILGVDEAEQSMTFAGDIPEGAYVRFMKANFDRLIDGATGAARLSYETIGSFPPDLALLISCLGRKIVLGQRVEEEVEGVRDVFGDAATLMGFYSYGEISPLTPSARCELHNQTMTITTFAEL